jgi:hypothetical protein
VSDPLVDARVRIVTIVVLGVNLMAAIIGLAFTAVLTDRDLFRPEVMALVLALAIATVGGLPRKWWRRQGRWRIEHNHSDGEDS